VSAGVSKPGARRTVLVLAVLATAIIALIPVNATRFIPSNDYPFHLARMVILAQLDNPIFAQIYQRGSLLLPNQAMDGIVVPLSKLLGPEAATRIFVELTILVTLLGTVLLHWAAHKRLSVWPLVAVALLYNGIFRFGFFNYLFGLSVALCASALWMAMKPGVLRLAAAFVASIFLMYCHLEAFGIFAVIAGSIELRFDQTLNHDFFKGYQLYSFFDKGAVWNIRDGKDDVFSLSSAGAGIRLYLASELQLGVEVAAPLDFRSPTNEDRDPRVFFFLLKSFKLCPGSNHMRCS
jgi:hypothetical protein